MTTEQDRGATSVVVVNYRTKELTLEAARSALREPEVCEVLIVDNASGDGSAEFLRAAFPAATVQVTEAASNLGFGRAVNLVVASTACPLVLLLNSDATLVPGAVARLAAALLTDDSVGLVAPAVYEADGRTLQRGAYGRFPRVVGGRPQYGPNEAGATTPDWVSGVTMLMRRDDFVALGGFDPDFEMYLEDVDLCRRLRHGGKTVLREPGAGVVHLGGKSWRSSVEKRDHYQRSKITYFRKGGVTPATLALLQLLRALRVSAARAAALRTGHPR